MKKLTLLTLCLLLTAPLVAVDKKIIYPAEFKKHRPNMPFSPGVQVGNTLYVAGQTGGDIASGDYPEDFELEVHATFKRIGIILKDAGYDFSDVVDVKVYLTDIGTFRAMNSVYTQYFRQDRPARTTTAIASLVGKARIEITVVAVK